MSNLDGKFRDEISKLELTYNEAYWQQMEHLIEEDKRKKKFFYFRLSAISAGLVLMSSLLWFSYREGKTERWVESEIANQNKSIELTELPDNNLSPIPKETDQSRVSKTSNTEKQKSKLPFYSYTNHEQHFQNASGKERSTSHETIDQNESGFAPEIFQEGMLTMIGFHGFALKQELPEAGIVPKTMRPGQTSGSINSGDPFPSKMIYSVAFYVSANNYLKPGFSPEVSLYKQQENFKATQGFGLAFKARRNRVSYTAGLNYNQFVAVSDYAFGYRNVTYDTTLVIVNPNYGQTRGGTRIVLLKNLIDSNVTSGSQTPYPGEKLKISYVGIPMSVQYNIGIRKLNVYLEGGVQTQFLISSAGKYLFVKNGAPVVEDSRGKLSPVLFSASAGAGVSYPLGKHFSAFVSMNAFRQINSMLGSYGQRLGSMRFNAGLEFTIR